MCFAFFAVDSPALNSPYPAPALTRFARALLTKSGLSSAMARDVAEILVEGDLLGKTTHGLQLLAPYLQNIADGKMTRTGRPKIIKRSAATLLLDARYLPGPFVLRGAIGWAIPRAKKHGVATVAIRQCHHIACLQAFLQPVADRGLVMLLMCNDPAVASVAAPGGVEGVCSPDPVAVGIPTTGQPILIDTTTASATNGIVARLTREKRKLSSLVLQTALGEPTDDPSVLIAKLPGTILPLGGLEQGYKGFAFAVMVEALTGALAGHGRADKPTRWGASIFLQIIDPKFFSGGAAFNRETTYFAKTCRQSKTRPHGSPVRMPGDDAQARRRQQLERGIILHPGIMPALQPWAEKLGVKIPKPLPAADARPKRGREAGSRKWEARS